MSVRRSTFVVPHANSTTRWWSIAKGKPLEEILGVSLPQATAKIVHNPDRPQIRGPRCPAAT